MPSRGPPALLAYVFWHRPRHPAALEDYERALIAFHRSLARTPPAGTRASACYRVGRLPWTGEGPPPAGGEGAAREPAYEDWYLVEDYAALGVLNGAATGRGHRSSHDEVAVRSREGAGGLYALLEGEPDAQALAGASVAVWITPQLHGASRRRMAAGVEDGLAELLGDGMDGARASLWRRQLVLGPAPEFCAVGAEVPRGASSARLPRGWRSTTLEREVLYSG